MEFSDLSSQYGPLVAALMVAIVALATVVVILWKQNQRLHKELADNLRVAMTQALEREDKIHQALDRCEGILRACGQSHLPPPT